MFNGLAKTLVNTPEELIEGLVKNSKFSYSKKMTDEYRQKHKGEKDADKVVIRTREIFMAYDSETTQIDTIEYDEKGKPFENHYSTQISHQLGIEDMGIIVSTEQEFLNLLEFLKEHLCYEKKYKVYTKDKNGNKIQKDRIAKYKIIIYVHNLDYDLTFLLCHLNKDRTNEFVVKSSYTMFEWKESIIFKDSKNLLGHGLDVSIKEYLGEDSPYRKRYGKWDYDIIRSPKYKLSNDEIEYAMVDVFALIEILRTICKNQNLKYSQLPMTKSTIVGNKMKKELLDNIYNESQVDSLSRDKKNYYNLLHDKLNLTYYELLQAKESYYGGVSFTNPLYADEYTPNLGSHDLASEYPRALVAQLFPMSKPVARPDIKDIKTLEEGFKFRKGHEIKKDLRQGFMAKFTFHNYRANPEFPIPFMLSYDDFKIGRYDAEKYILTGNRIYKAEKVTIFLCDVDYFVLKDTATWDRCDVEYVITYDLAPLPTSLVRLILESYKDKTVLKGVVGEEVAYNDAKVFVNTIYGKQGQFPLNDKYVPDENGHPVKQPLTLKDKEDLMEKHNKKVSRTTYYLWGVYTSAYGHRFLYNGMKIVREDIRFCDTDSVKYANRDKYLDKFEEYNRENEKWLRFTGEYWHNFTDKEIEELYFPKTKEGESQPIGNWDSEIENKKMGTMVGAISKRSKCYVMIFQNKEGKYDMKFTCAGIAKDAIKSYCLVTMCKDEDEVYENGIFDKNKINKNKQEAIKENVNKFRVEDKNGNLDYIASVVKFFKASPAIPPEFTNKMTKLVNYEQKPYKYIDAQGNEDIMTNTSAVYLIPCGFKLNAMGIDSLLEEFLTGNFVTDECEIDGTFFD